MGYEIKSKYASKLFAHLSKHGWTYLQFLGFSATALSNLLKQDSYYFYILIIAGVLMYCIGAIFGKIADDEFKEKANKYDKLEEDLEETQQDLYHSKKSFQTKTANLLEQILRVITERNLSFCGTDRISIYLKNPEAFVLVGRYSEHPIYNETNRYTFPIKEGSIAIAWEGKEGYNYSPDLPDPESSTEDYLDYLKNNHGISNDTANELRMPSRFYYSRVLKNHQNSRIGVVVVESTETTRYTKQHLDNFFNSNKDLIIEFIHINRNLITALPRTG